LGGLLHNRGMLRSGKLRCWRLGFLAFACASSALAAPKKTPSDVPHPAMRILIAPLGFTAPAAIYQPYRVPQSSLGFLDAKHLLFTFHVSRLMRRVPNDPATDLDQTIHAVVLDLPGGKVSAEADWRLHDRDRYVWTLKDGTFLLRMRDTFYLGDTSLKLQTYLSPVGTFMFGEMSPDAGMFEAEYVNQVAGHALANAAPAPSLLGDGVQFPKPTQNYTVLIVNTHDLETRRVNDLATPIALPLVSGGYVTPEQGKGREWTLMLNPWKEPARSIAKVESSCRPEIEPISADVFLTLDCLPYTTDHVVTVFSLNGKQLWDQRWQSRFVWGTFAFSQTGNRFAYGSLEINHELGTLDPVEDASILGQPVGVFQVQSGKADLVLDASPFMTAGENFALSPSGDRFAIVRNGAIEIYDLPPIDPAPEPASSKTK
jgi:hypothetical protein